MTRSYVRFTLLAVAVAAFAVASAVPCLALMLISPTQDQIVRENVKVALPASQVPEESFISIMVGDPGAEQFVMAVDSKSVVSRNGVVTVVWNSKAPYRTMSDPKTDRFFKDGVYSLRAEIHQQSSNSARILDSGSVKVVLKNKIARSNPAPGVSLVNRLSFGQLNTYHVRANAEVFQVVSGVGLPIAGGLGLSSDFKIVQSVEDVRGDGGILLRYRMDPKASVTAFGQRTLLYNSTSLKPQIYTLMDKYGNVSKRNMFKKQAQYTITGVLPILPKRTVKEGDSWSDSLYLKIEGITDPIEFKGSCMLDSFEWQNGKECVKLVSQMTGSGKISLAQGGIRSTGAIKANVVTYFAYKTGRLIKRDISLEFPADVDSGIADMTQTPAMTSGPGVPGYSTSPLGDDDDDDSSYSARGNSPVIGAPMPGGMPMSGNSGNAKKGTVIINTAILLES
ncbi:MAG: hypothetical protein ABFD54_03985 [Armatimonadota bacterium]|nr:hypothetical protein [bacterium]